MGIVNVGIQAGTVNGGMVKGTPGIVGVDLPGMLGSVVGELSAVHVPPAATHACWLAFVMRLLMLQAA